MSDNSPTKTCAPRLFTSLQTSAQLERMAVRVIKIKRSCLHPFVPHGTADCNSLLPEHFRRAFDIRFVKSKGKMLRRPFTFIFLQYDHAGVTARAQEQPV